MIVHSYYYLHFLTFHPYLHLSFFLKKYGIINAIKNEASDGESSTEKNIESLKENIKQLTNEMKSLAKHTRDNKLMLNELVKRMINEDMDEM